MDGFIYKVTNKVTGKSYIGQTRNTVEFRWRQHYNAKDNKYFHRAIQKYGKDQFEVSTIEQCDVSKLDEREIYWINHYDTFNNGYNMAKGGSVYHEHNRCVNGYIEVDDKYDEIKAMYLSGFSTYYISNKFNIDRHCASNILKSMGVNVKYNDKININNYEFEQLANDYKSGWSLKQLAKRYGCSADGLKAYMIKRGVEMKDKFNILKDEDAQISMINDYLSNNIKLRDIQAKYHCEYATFLKVLSMHGIKQKGIQKTYKLSNKDALQILEMLHNGKLVKEIASIFKVDKDTIYNLLKRYGVDYKNIITSRVSES